MIVGVLGGGQLARMLALAAHPLGIQVVFLDPSEEACAAPVAKQLQGNYDDKTLLQQLAEQCDVITYEFENVPVESVEFLQQSLPVYPPSEALKTGQDRLFENILFKELGIPVADFVAVNSLDDLHQAAEQTGLPAVLKTRREGYDGKGQAVIKSKEQLAQAWSSINEKPAILEAFVPFEREVSVIAARDQNGQTKVYPLSQNQHKDGILNTALCLQDDPLQQKAEDYVTRLLTHLDYVGVMALELFQKDDELLANEFSPRVHNSSHWTIEGAQTGQFENHMRAVCGMPLGDTSALGYSLMFNCIGKMPVAKDVLAVPGAHLHDYNKSDRPGRKVGHITLRCSTREQMLDSMAQIEKLLKSL